MLNKIKSIFSRIYIGSQRKKKLIPIKKSFISLDVLNLLWKEGFIYGYFLDKKMLFYYVFIKPFNINCLWGNLEFKNQLLKKNKLSDVFIKEKNLLIFLLNEKGLFFVNCTLNKNMSGVVLIKI